MNNEQNNGFNSLYNNDNNTNPKSTINNPFDIIMDDEPENDTFSNSINIVPLNNKVDNSEKNNYQNTNKKQMQSNNLNQTQQITNLNDFQRKDLLMTYVGFKYEKFSTQVFNIPALIFAEFYLFYRRMTLFGLLMLISRTLLFVYVNPYISFIINILLAFSFNKVYLYHAKKKINKIEKK